MTAPSGGLDPRVVEWLKVGKGGPTSIDIALFPHYDARTLHTVAAVHMPNAAELDKVIIVLSFEGGQLQRVVPVPALKDQLERYFPPSGRYYDEGTIKLSMDTSSRRCVSCWHISHGKPGECRNQCFVCETKDHLGFECTMIYARFAWWKQKFGWTIIGSTPIHPNAGELAYLIVAGIFLYQPGMSCYDPLVLNKHHPAVKAWYQDRQLPHCILPGWYMDPTDRLEEVQRKHFPVAESLPEDASSTSATSQKRARDDRTAVNEDRWNRTSLRGGCLIRDTPIPPPPKRQRMTEEEFESWDEKEFMRMKEEDEEFELDWDVANRRVCDAEKSLKNKYKDDLKHVESLRLMYGHAQRQADRSEKRLKKAQYMIANELFMCLPVDWSEEHLDFETEEDGDNGLE